MSPSQRFAGYFFIGVAGLLAAPAVQAQQSGAEESAPDNEPKLEEVIVTGSRIRQDSQSFANPVTTFSAQAILQSGKTDLGDFLAQTPALVGSTTGDLTAGSNPDFGEAGLNLLDLRHLGVDRTLVLVDGRRHVSGLAGSAAVDIDSIPTDLLESVDVLCETCAPEWPERAARAIREEVGRVVGIRVVEGAHGVIQRTSSGKPKRRSMWEQVTSGALELRVHLDWPAASAAGEEPRER